MQLQTHPWEHTLLSLAVEARQAATPHHPLQVDAHVLDEAYRHCETMTAEHSRSFHLASALLPDEKRRAVRALYAFCRTADDLVDCHTEHRAQRLEHWRRQILGAHPPENDPVALAWTDARLRHHVPIRYAEQLIDGVARDLTTSRYATFDALAAYCYGVASTVGLMSMHIVGFAGAEALPYAIKLGVALQITNILRDVAEDWRAGRLYLPQADLAHFGLSETDIAERVATGLVDARWRAFMRFQVARNRRLYDEAMPGIRLLADDGRFAIAAAAELYRAILVDIEEHDYDVFTRRAHVSTWGKVRRLPLIWWRSRKGFNHLTP
ncbi:MAG: squalene/phytoene synthase family protein [Caldilineaceae bacterium]|nr:squalene/phytoene synthase family protein [Caldilineaceae bacterium]